MDNLKSSLTSRVYSFIKDSRLLKPGDSVMVALSGGADSVCLLEVLLRLEKRLDITVCAFHMNHMIRKSAGEDEEFVKRLCEEKGVRLFSLRSDVPGISEKTGRGLEETGRDERYRIMEETACKEGIDRIATAHHLDDNAESVIMNIARGSGLEGLKGIAVKSGKIIRPLIILEKSEIEEFLSKEGVPYVEDETNSDISYARNRIRHRVMPELEAVNERASLHILNLSKAALEYSAFLDECLENVKISVSKYRACVSFEEFRALNPVLKKHLIIKMAGLLGEKKDISRAVLEKACCLSEKGETAFDISLAGCCELKRRYGELFIEKTTDTPVFTEGELTEEVPFDTGMYTVLISSQPAEENNQTKYIDKEKINGKLYVRARRSGDRFTPFSLRGSKTLKKYMIDKKIPRELRDSLPVICDEKGIVAVGTMDIADRVRTTAQTKEVLYIFVKNRK